MFAPEILPGYEPWVDAFWDASTERQIGMGIGLVPISAIESAAARIGIEDPDEFERFKGAMRAMDRVWLDEVRKETDASGTTSKAQPVVSSQPLNTPAMFDAIFG